MYYDLMFCLGVIGFVLTLIILSLKKSYKESENIKKAAEALGDNFYTTGVPSAAWKKYARSFPEYKRLLRALAKSGDFSKHNVDQFVSGFSGRSSPPDRLLTDDEDLSVVAPLRVRNEYGIMGYREVGNDGGAYNQEATIKTHTQSSDCF